MAQSPKLFKNKEQITGESTREDERTSLIKVKPDYYEKIQFTCHLAKTEKND